MKTLSILIILLFAGQAYAGVTSFNCIGLATRKKTNNDQIEFSIRGCTDEFTGELVNCSGAKLEPNLVVSRTVLRLNRDGIRERKLAKTYEIPRDMIREFSRVDDRLKIYIKQKLDLAEVENQSLRYGGFVARPGTLRFANFTNEKTKRVMMINFGRYMAGVMVSSIRCNFL